MAKHPWLFLREEKDGTRRYYLRARVPLDLVNVIGKREIKKSLRTADPKEARELIDIEAAKLKQHFSDARRKLNDQPKGIAAFSETDLQRLVLVWFRGEEQRAGGQNFYTLPGDELDALREGLEEHEGAFLNPDDPGTLAVAQAQADAILIDAGLPSTTPPTGRFKGGSVADVDKASPYSTSAYASLPRGPCLNGYAAISRG